MRLLDQVNIEPGFLLAAGIALLAFVLLRRSMRHYRRTRSQQPVVSAVERTKPSSALLDAPHEVLRWQVEMHDTARDLKAELDSKISALQALLLLAQEERQRLEEVLDRSQRRPQNGASYGKLPASAAIEPPSGPVMPGSEQQRADIYALSDQGDTPQQIAEQLAVPVGEVEFVLGLRGR